MFSERKLLIAFGLASFVVATATAQSPPPPGPLPVSATDVDPVTDLAGALILPSSGGSGTLYSTGGDQGNVLSSLGATGSGGTYTATINGATVTFNVITAALPYMFLPPGDIVCSNSVVRVYKNAQCTNVSVAHSMGCTTLGTGGVTETWTASNKCLKGSAYCTEVNQVYWTRYTWNDHACTSLSGITTGNDFICH